MNDNDNSNVVVLNVETTLDIPLERVLDGAQRHAIEDAVVLGYWPGTTKLFFASCSADMAQVLALLERTKAMIIRLLDEHAK